MNKFILLLTLFLISCSNNKAAIEAKARHQDATGDRINESQKNTDSLFKDID